MASTTDLEALRPQKKQLVMNLLREAGVDVSDWANYRNGVRAPAANPKYCYEWVFVQEPGKVVLNIWHQELEVAGGTIQLSGNMREIAELERSNGTGVRMLRAQKVDSAVREAWSRGATIRTIICSGERRSVTKPGVASRVNHRMLDSMTWAVHSYDNATGLFTLVRNDLTGRTVDQFALGIEVQSSTEIRAVSGFAYVRSVEVRRSVLSRADRRCEFCGELGFELPGGLHYLETHHIVPLSEGGPDTEQNVAAVCATHHREAHYGTLKEQIRAKLTMKASGHGENHVS